MFLSVFLVIASDSAQLLDSVPCLDFFKFLKYECHTVYQGVVAPVENHRSFAWNGCLAIMQIWLSSGVLPEMKISRGMNHQEHACNITTR